MSLKGTYDPDNIFAKILRGEMPCVKVYEDGHTLGFMDVFPQSRGHMLVIHKQAKARNLLDVSHADLCNIMNSVQNLARAAEHAGEEHQSRQIHLTPEQTELLSIQTVAAAKGRAGAIVTAPAEI